MLEGQCARSYGGIEGNILIHLQILFVLMIFPMGFFEMDELLCSKALECPDLKSLCFNFIVLEIRFGGGVLQVNCIGAMYLFLNSLILENCFNI